MSHVTCYRGTHLGLVAAATFPVVKYLCGRGICEATNARFEFAR